MKNRLLIVAIVITVVVIGISIIGAPTITTPTIDASMIESTNQEKQDIIKEILPLIDSLPNKDDIMNQISNPNITVEQLRGIRDILQSTGELSASIAQSGIDTILSESKNIFN